MYIVKVGLLLVKKISDTRYMAVGNEKKTWVL